jgi:hypothetical protein
VGEESCRQEAGNFHLNTLLSTIYKEISGLDPSSSAGPAKNACIAHILLIINDIYFFPDDSAPFSPGTVDSRRAVVYDGEK